MKVQKRKMFFKAVCLMSVIWFFGCSKPSANDVLGPIAYTKPEASVNDGKSSLRDWDIFIGQYQLVAMNGTQVPIQHAEIQPTISSYYDRSKQKYIDGLLFPLFYDVGSTSASKYIFGPFNIEGAFTKKIDTLGTTYFFSYSGPINFQGIELQLNLNISCTQKDNLLYVDYEIEIPNNVRRTKNSLVFSK